MAIKIVRGNPYCYRSVRVGRTVRSEYVGPAWMAPVLDVERRKRTEDRRRREEQDQAVKERERAVAGWFHRTERVVALYLVAAGCHQHKRQWRRRRAMNDQHAIETTVIAPAKVELSPESRAILARVDAGDKSVTPAEARRLLAERPDLLKSSVTPAEATMHAWVNLCYKDDPFRRESLIRHYERTRDDLAGPAPTPTETILAERAAICWLEVNTLEMCVAFSNKADRLTIRRVESANRRFLSAVRTLAVVRKLKLPDLKVTIDGRSVYYNARQCGTDPDDAQVLTMSE